jgi:NADP-dependent 3-hydroxy acid dehydrogenase YdfG
MTALVTGTTRGIGRALALHLASGGTDVVALGRDAAALAALASEGGPRIMTAAADVTDGAAVRRAVEAAGDLDLVVANAGVLLGAGALWEADVDAWWRGFEVNVLGPVHTLRAVLPRMIERGSGRVVVMASGIGTKPSPWDTSYGASKAAVLQLCSSVQQELEGSGVLLFPISPGMVRTDMTRFPEELTRHVPELADLPDDAFTPVELVLGLVDRIAAGGLDPLAGRFLHARDDLDRLLAEVDARDGLRARTLRVAPAYDGDPRA